MQAGERSIRIEIQSKTVTVSDSGKRTETWTTTARRWAQVNPRNVESQPGDDKTMFVVKFPYDRGLNLTTQNRIKKNSKVLNIAAITNPNEANVDLELLCSEERQ